MTQIYEGMFVLDNDLVRTGWPKAKAAVSDLLEKHGGTVHTSRRWAERKLAYPIKRRQRATYLLTYYEIPAESIPNLVRDLDLAEPILRYLLLQASEVPAKENELSAAEASSEFVVAEPPADDAGSYKPLQTEGGEDEEEESEAPPERGRPGSGAAPEGASKPASEAGAKPTPEAGAKPAPAPAPDPAPAASAAADPPAGESAPGAAEAAPAQATEASPATQAPAGETKETH